MLERQAQELSAKYEDLKVRYSSKCDELYRAKQDVCGILPLHSSPKKKT